jgi:hypothetical protein
MPRGIVEPLFEARKLLLRTDMEIEFQYGCVGSRQACFEIVYQFVSLRPHPMWHQLVHPHHQDILIIGAIEDHHLAFGRHTLVARQRKS